MRNAGGHLRLTLAYWLGYHRIRGLHHLVRLDLQVWKLVLLLVCWLVVALMLGHFWAAAGKYPEHSIFCTVLARGT